MSNSKMFARRKQRVAAAGADPYTTDRGLEPKEMSTDDVRLAAAPEVSKTAGDAKSQGRYVTLIQTVTNKLQFVPNPATIKEFITDNKHHLPAQALEVLVLDVDPGRKSNRIWSDDTVLSELLEDLTNKGWQWLEAQDLGINIGINVPILEAPDGRVYWHEKHVDESAGEALLLGATVIFDGAPDNKPLTSLGEEPMDDVLAPAAPLVPEVAGKLSSVPDRRKDSFKEDMKRKQEAEKKDEKKASAPKTAEEHPAPFPPDAGSAAVAPPAVPPVAGAPVEPAAASGGTTGKYKYWTAEALAEVSKTLAGISDYDNDKAAQQAVAEMSEELFSRPKTAPEAKAASKTASFDPELERQINYAIEAIYKFQIDGEQDTQLITKALQSVKNIVPTGLTPEQIDGLNRAIKELEAFDEGQGGEIARAVVELEDVIGRSASKVAAYGSFAVNEETSKVLEGDKSIPDGRELVEDNTGIVRPSGTTTPSKVASEEKTAEYDVKNGVPQEKEVGPHKCYSDARTWADRKSHCQACGKVIERGKQATAPVTNNETSKVLEGDKSIPDGRGDVEDNTGITRPATVNPSKFASIPVVETSKTASEAAQRQAALAHYAEEEAEEEADEATKTAAKAAVEAASKTAAAISTAKALSLAESMSDKLKALYLDAKPLTAVNGTRPVRTAVESVYQAMVNFGEAVKALSTQDRQEKEEAIAAEAAMPKKKAALEAKERASRIGGLRIAVDSAEDAAAE